MDLNIAVIYNNLETNEDENECEDETKRTKRIHG